MTEFKPVLIHDNSSLREVKAAGFGSLKDTFQEAVNSFNGLTFVKDGKTATVNPVSSNEITAMLGDPEGFIVDRMTAGGIGIQGLKISKSKAFELLEKPGGFDDFMVILDGFKSRFNVDAEFYQICPVSEIEAYFEINKHGEVVFTNTLITMLDGVGKVYAKNEKQAAIYNFLTGLFSDYVASGAVNSRFTSVGGKAGIVELINNCVERVDLKTGKFEIKLGLFGGL